MIASTVATSRPTERRSLRSPPPKPKTRVARPPVPTIPLHFLKPQPQPEVKPTPEVKPQPKVKPSPRPQHRRTKRECPAVTDTRVAHRHAHLYDYKPIAGAQYQSLKCKLIFLHEARKRDSIVYHSVRSIV